MSDPRLFSLSESKESIPLTFGVGECVCVGGQLSQLLAWLWNSCIVLLPHVRSHEEAEPVPTSVAEM